MESISVSRPKRGSFKEIDLLNDEIKLDRRSDKADNLDEPGIVLDNESMRLIDEMIYNTEEKKKEPETPKEQKTEYKPPLTQGKGTKAADVWCYFEKKKVKAMKKGKRGLTEVWTTRAECAYCGRDFCRNVTV